MAFSKDNVERLASRMKETRLLKDDASIPHFRKRNRDLTSFFSVDGPLWFCNNIDVSASSLHHNVFITSSKRSLKAPVLHNGNKKPFIPIRHSVRMKECYENMQVLLDAIKYPEYNWSRCGDLKVINMFMWIQSEFMNYCCFYAFGTAMQLPSTECNQSGPCENHMSRGSVTSRVKPLVKSENILLPSLNIKLAS